MDVRWDAIVVGGGHNGLICAAYLARSGLRTLLVEARESVGGCASTVDAIGARINICNCDHVMVRATPIVDELDLVTHGLRYLDVDPAFLHFMWDEASPPWFLYRSPERTVRRLDATSPQRATAYRHYLDTALPAARLVAALAGTSPTLRNVLPHLVRSGVQAARTVLDWSRRSAVDVLGSFFSDEAMIVPAVTTGPVVWGVSPSSPGTGLGALAYGLRHVVGVGRPVGGSGALTDAIRLAFESAGGIVRCSTRVEAVQSEAGLVGAVQTAAGTLFAPLVVGACDPAILGVAAGNSDHEGFESKIDAVVDEPPRYRILNLLAEPDDIDPLVPTAVISPSLAEIEQGVEVRSQGAVLPRPMMLANLPSVLDPTMRPPAGGHVLSLEVLWTPYSLQGGWRESGEPRRWLDQFASLVQPGFTDSIREWRVMTPVDYEEQFGLRKGYAPSFPGSPIDALRGRPRHLARYRTDTRGLYLTGAATYPGAGIWGASGRNAALAVLADHG